LAADRVSKSRFAVFSPSLVNVRRLSQFLFLVLFFVLLIRTTLVGEDDTEPWATFFFDIDPLILLSTLFASHAVLSGMLLALVTVALTLLLGRFFCGWVCPVGATFNIVSWARKAPLPKLIKTGTWNQWQKSKYLLLTALLVSALAGLNLAGVFDPFSLFYRTMATSVYPAFQWGAEQFFGWLYYTDPGIGPVRVTLISEPIYGVLRDYVLTNQPLAYAGGVLIGILFVFLVVMALFHFRFWCRYLCPLGALLGVFSKTGRIHLNLNNDRCNDCKMCVAFCPGACDPHLSGRWKKEECYLCFTCRDLCPSAAISFDIKLGDNTKELVGPTNATGHTESTVGNNHG
jgi:polyferredoxin